MKLLILNPPNPELFQLNRDLAGGFGAASLKEVTVLPPLNVFYVGSVLINAGHDVTVKDCAAENLNSQQVIELCKQDTPKIVFANTASATYKQDIMLLDLLKERFNCQTAIFGPHASLKYNYALKESKIDFIILGEPEFVIKDLVGKIEKNQDFTKLRGIIYRMNGRIINNLEAEKIQNLDEIPFPLWDGKIKNYLFKSKKNSPFVTMQTQRGCPYNCMYCPYPVTQGVSLRMRSVENVVREMELLKGKFGIKTVFFRDPCFSFNQKRTKELCELMISRRVNTINWWCETAALSLNEDLLKLMAKAGCSGINFGVESGNAEMLTRYSKKTGGKDMLKTVFNLCKKYKIETTAFFLIGLPCETKKSVEETIDFSKELDPDYVYFHLAAPFPGTKLEKEYHMPKGQEEERTLDCHTPSFIPEGLSKEELNDIVKEAYKAFYFRPKRVVKEIIKRPETILPRIVSYLNFRKGKNHVTIGEEAVIVDSET